MRAFSLAQLAAFAAACDDGPRLAVSETIGESTQVFVESFGATLGVINESTQVIADGSGHTNADFAILPGVIAVWDKTATITQSVASISAASDLSNAAWTKTGTGITITTNVAGTQDRITCGTTAPTVSQNITNCQNNATAQVPLTVTWWFSYESIQWVVMQLRASTAVSCVFFDVQNGAVGRQDSGVAGSIAAETRNGVAGYRCTVVATAVGATCTARFGLSTTDTTITLPANGTSVRADDCTVSQVRTSSWIDRKNSYTIDQATVSLQPETGTDAAGPYIKGYAQQYMIGSAAAVVAAFAGTNKEFTIHIVAKKPTANLTTCSFSAATSTQATNGAHTFGTANIGGGIYRSAKVSDTGTSANADGSDVYATGAPHVQEWYTASTGASMNLKIDGTAANGLPDPQAPGATNPDRFGILARVGSVPNTISAETIYAIVITSGAPDTSQNAQVTAALKTQFGIP